MIDTMLHLLFGCSHRHLTRPFTPLAGKGVPHRGTYVVCLDCAKQFAYDLNEMQVGMVIDHSHDACVLPPGMLHPRPRKTKVAYVLGLAVPVAVLVGAVLRDRKSAAGKNAEP